MKWLKEKWDKLDPEYPFRIFRNEQQGTLFTIIVIFVWLVSGVALSILFHSAIIGGLGALGILFLIQYLIDLPRKQENEKNKIAFEETRTRYIKNLEKKVKKLGGKVPSILQKSIS